MLIRHDPHLSRGRLLMPVPRREWMPPSRTLLKDQLGNDIVRTRFRLTARAHDGHPVWSGWFCDRDDADAFLCALASGSLGHERELWRLPTPEWHPGLGEELSYHFVTVTFLTATTSSTYNKPADWSDTSNKVECIGGGGSGGATNRNTNTNALGTGGGGGGYGIYTNLSLSGNATYQCGTGGNTVTRTTAGVTNGNNGADTWFGVSATDYASASVGATLGSAGAASNSASANGGAGGSGKGTNNFSGGRGGNITGGTNNRIGTGGGGAGGPSGAGNAGTDNGGGTSAATNGGSGGAGAGGASGTGNVNSNGTAGGNGTEFSASYGSGGGGGGVSTQQNNTHSAGSGGNYGGGGGGIGGGSTTTLATSVTSGAGIQGLIVVTYGFSLVFNYQPFQHILVR